MRVLVTGATGFVGKHLVSELLELGHSVNVLGRSPEKAARLFGNAVTFYAWDPQVASPGSEAFQGVDSVIHLAGEGIADRRWSNAQKLRIYNSRVQGTKNLVNTINSLGTNGPKAFISASAVGFYGDRGDEQLTARSSAGSGFLSELCSAWEREIFSANEGVRTVALRIGIVLGREGGALERLLPVFAKGLGGPIGGSRQWMSWIHIHDLVALVIEAARNGNYRGPVNAVAPTPITNADFSKALGRALGRPALFPAPAIALKLAMGELSVLVLSSQRVNPDSAVENSFPFRFRTIDSALGEIARNTEHVLERYQLLPKTSAEIFPFFSDERNLEFLTPPWLHFKVEKKSTDSLREGSLIDYRLRVHGVPLRWQSRILEWKKDSKFVDEQVHGPYRVWHHSHDFFPVEGGTLMRDRVRYEVPRVPIVRSLLERFVARDLERIFAYRRKQIAHRFGVPGKS